LANPNDKTVAITLDDLKTLITEIRKPVPTVKEIQEEVQLKAEREAMQETLKQNERNRLYKMETCSHMRGNGSTTAVYVHEPLNKLYCQACSAWISPIEQPELFNRLYPLSQGLGWF
jgi:hypothetical protein